MKEAIRRCDTYSLEKWRRKQTYERTTTIMFRRLFSIVTTLLLLGAIGCQPNSTTAPVPTPPTSKSLKSVVGKWQWEKDISLYVQSINSDVSSTIRTTITLNDGYTGNIRTTVVSKTPQELEKLEMIVQNQKVAGVPDLEPLRPHDKTVDLQWKDQDNTKILIAINETGDKLVFTYSLSPSGNELSLTPTLGSEEPQVYIRIK